MFWSSHETDQGHGKPVPLPITPICTAEARNNAIITEPASSVKPPGVSRPGHGTLQGIAGQRVRSLWGFQNKWQTGVRTGEAVSQGEVGSLGHSKILQHMAHQGTRTPMAVSKGQNNKQPVWLTQTLPKH